jgi:signal transduction histidine kinase
VAPAPGTAVDLSAEAAEVLEMFAPLAGAAGARLELHAAPHVVAAADSSAVRQVLLNFLDNATRYGPRGQCVALGVEGGGGRVRVWVEDEGPGVPQAERARVFAPYYRMARDAAVTGGGSGIGLAVVRDLVERQGGRAWVEDGRLTGRGARFVAEFPAAPAGTPRDEEPPVLESRTGEWRVVDTSGRPPATDEAAGDDAPSAPTVPSLAGAEPRARA